MDTELARAMRASLVEHVRRFFPKYDNSPTSVLSLPDLELGSLDPPAVNHMINFLNDATCRLLKRLAYVPVTYTSHMEQVGCGICGQPYANRFHVPVKLRCGCVFGECCVVSRLLHTVPSGPIGVPGAGECVAPWCRQPWTPLRDWNRVRRLHAGSDDQSWIEELECAEKGMFLDAMWIRWMEIALNTPAGSRPVLIIQDDQAAIQTAHDGITHLSYRMTVADLTPRALAEPIIRDGRIAKYLAEFFAQHAGEQFEVSDTTIGTFRASTMAYINCTLVETETERHHSYDETVIVPLKNYTDKLIKHALVQMRINMNMFF